MAFWSAISRATGTIKEAVLEGPSEEDQDRAFAALKSHIKALETRCEEYQKLLNQQSEEAAGLRRTD